MLLLRVVLFEVNVHNLCLTKGFNSKYIQDIIHWFELPMKNPKGKAIEPNLTNLQGIKALGASLEEGSWMDSI
jgi:hypothetical protein